MTTKVVEHPSVADRRAGGADARWRTPLSGHAGWAPPADRPDPVALLEEQNTTREPDLVPVRHGRMMVSPFTFYRGAAKIMATDLAGTPTAGFTSQLCGDAHLSNFGVFASPERRLLFDLNDFDETLPGPFEYDVKRMAASFTIAARNNALTRAEGSQVTTAAVRAYREAMAGFARMGVLELWYARMSEDDLQAAVGTLAADGKVTKDGKAHGRVKPGKDVKAAKSAKSGKDIRAAKAGAAAPGSAAWAAKQAEKNLRKARTRDSLQALSKLGELVDGHYRIVSQPPIVVPIRDIEQQYGMTAGDVQQAVHDQFREYRSTLEDDRRHLLERFEVIDMARKVVGVGSVGTRAFIVLLQGRDDQDPLFLQVKEATRSVLEDHLPKSRYRNPGERVVRGQRMMQASSDIFLGWTKGVQADRYLYWRQLRDMKGSAVVDTMSAFMLEFYAGMCGWTLARAHARSGDPVAMAAYLGTGDEFDASITDFANRYADQNEIDYQAFVTAVRTGRIPAVEGI
ncbi:MAG TPA: DUF2252 domain-containing protein [Nakamurella sp.]